MDGKDAKYFKIGLGIVAAFIILVVIMVIVGMSVQGQTTRTILFENLTFIFEEDANFSKQANILGTISGSSLLKIREGISLVNDDFESLYDIFVSQSPNIIMQSEIPQSTNNALVIQRSGPPNDNFIGVVFWDSDTNRPLFVMNAGDPGRATTLNRSFQIGKDFASGILDLDYTICENTILADCDTILTGADLVVEDDIEAFGSQLIHENLFVDGNLSFTGTFGELFQVDAVTTILLPAVNVFVPIDGFSPGNLSNVLASDTNLTIERPGFYLLNYSISFFDANNREFESGILVNGVLQDSGRVHTKLSANDFVSMGSTAILDLNQGNDIGLAIANLTNNSDPTIESATITISYIGEN